MEVFRRVGITDDEPADLRQDEPTPHDRIPESADSEPDYEPMNGATAAPTEIQPFETFDTSQWEGVPIEPRRWIAENRIPVGEPGIMSGDGGTGKTKLALQLAVLLRCKVYLMPDTPRPNPVPESAVTCRTVDHPARA